MGRNNLSIMKVIYKPQRIAIRHKSNVSVPGTSQAPASAFGRSSNSGNTNEKLKSPIYHSFNKRRFKVHISEKEKVKKNLFGSTDPDRDYHQSTYFPNSINKIFKDKHNRRTLSDHSNSSSSLGSRTFQRMMSLKDMFLKPEIRRKRLLPVEKKEKGRWLSKSSAPRTGLWNTLEGKVTRLWGDFRWWNCLEHIWRVFSKQGRWLVAQNQ